MIDAAASRDVLMGSHDRHHVVVVGSGFGGLAAVRGLARADVNVTMLARTSHHLFQPLLYQVATGILSEGEVAPSVREVLSRQDNARVLLGDVTHFDLDHRTVRSQLLGRQTQVAYDTLVVAAGATQSYFGNDHFARHAPGLKTVDDALEIRGRIFGALELAEVAASRGKDVDHLLTFAVVGAGPTGIEIAGQIAELARHILPREFRAIRNHRVRVILVDAGHQVLQPFGSRLGARTHQALERLGVEVLLRAVVIGVDARGLALRHTDGRSAYISAQTKIWAAGVRANPIGQVLAEQSGASLDSAGRVAVEPDLTLRGYPEVFVIGDMAALPGVPGVAQAASQGGRYAATAIKRRLRHRPRRAAFTYRDKGSMATISRFRAVAQVGRIELSGTFAWLLWLLVHLTYLTGFRNRFSAVLHWSVSFVGRGRSERTATEQQVFAREALTRMPGSTATRATTSLPSPPSRVMTIRNGTDPTASHASEDVVPAPADRERRSPQHEQVTRTEGPPRQPAARGHRGASQESSAVDLPPHIDTSDQPFPGPAHQTLRRTG